MGNLEQIERLKEGSSIWNTWRIQHPNERIDLSGANLGLPNISKTANLGKIIITKSIVTRAELSGVNLSRANLSNINLIGANLTAANLSYTNLIGADLTGADLTGAKLNNSHLMRIDLTLANLTGADLKDANLEEADLTSTGLEGAILIGADLTGSKLIHTNLTGADLTEVKLNRATLIETNLENTTLTQCSIYGISAWEIQLKGAKQENLIITKDEEPIITVDNLKIAQFVYLLLNNAEIRDVINTITTKVVLILGRFTPERKVVLDALREALRTDYNYLPVLFDFEKPSSRNFTETVRTLAHLARFVIADLSEPRSIPQELQAIIPLLRVPVKPILSNLEQPYSMFDDFDERDYHWVLPTYVYINLPHLLATLKEQVIDPAEQKAKELEKR